MRNPKLWMWLSLSFCILIAPKIAISGSVDPEVTLKARSFFEQSLPTGWISILIKSEDPATTKDKIRAGGGLVHSIIGNILTADIPAENVKTLGEQIESVYLENGYSANAALDKSVLAIKADADSQKITAKGPYAGKGVIVGIVDTGIDWTHPDFKDAAGASRIIAVWDQYLPSVGGFNAPREIEDSYGIECTRKNIEALTCPSRDYVGHGTHVAGIIGGSDPIYKGVAPDVEFVIVKALDDSGSLDTRARIIDGINYIFKKAEDLGRPAVVNLSLGGLDGGAHDGRTLSADALSILSGSANGRAIVASAGNSRIESNDAVAGIHAGGTLNRETRALHFFSSLAGACSADAEFWMPKESTLSFAVGARGLSGDRKTPAVASGEEISQSFIEGRIKVVINATEKNNPQNGMQRTIVHIEATDCLQYDIGRGMADFDIILSGNGRFDAWTYGSGFVFSRLEGAIDGREYTYIPGDNQSSIGILASSPGVITVGSFITEPRFGDRRSEVGDLSTYSSFGPSLDAAFTGLKPEITAPGESIMSALSQWAKAENITYGGVFSKDGRHIRMGGTSMSAPHVSGAVALLFQARPDLSAAQVKQLIMGSALRDEFTGDSPNEKWGYGKLDTVKALQYVEEGKIPSLDLSNSKPPSTDESANSSGGAGCSLTSTANSHTALPLIFFLLILLFSLVQLNKLRMILLLLIAGAITGCAGSISGQATEIIVGNATVQPGTFLKLSDKPANATIYPSAKFIEIVSINDDATELHKVIIPFTMLTNNETILNAANYFGASEDSATLIVEKGEHLNDGEKFIISEIAVSVSGTLTIESADVAPESEISFSLKDTKMQPINIQLQILGANTEGFTVDGSYKATVDKSGTTGPLITSISDTTINTNSSIDVTGFHLSTNLIFKLGETTIPSKQSTDRIIELVFDTSTPWRSAKLTVTDDTGETTETGFLLTYDPSTFVRSVPIATEVSDIQINPASIGFFATAPGATSIWEINFKEGALKVSEETFETAVENFDINSRGDKIILCPKTGSPVLFDLLGGLNEKPRFTTIAGLEKYKGCVDVAITSGDGIVVLMDDGSGKSDLIAVQEPPVTILSGLDASRITINELRNRLLIWRPSLNNSADYLMLDFENPQILPLDDFGIFSAASSLSPKTSAVFTGTKIFASDGRGNISKVDVKDAGNDIVASLFYPDKDALLLATKNGLIKIVDTKSGETQGVVALTDEAQELTPLELSSIATGSIVKGLWVLSARDRIFEVVLEALLP